MAKQNCPIDGCEQKIPNALLMCRRRWFMVPKPLRDAIKQTVNGGLKTRAAYLKNIGEAFRLVEAEDSVRQ
jgi:hypothetical protein